MHIYIYTCMCMSNRARSLSLTPERSLGGWELELEDRVRNLAVGRCSKPCCSARDRVVRDITSWLDHLSVQNDLGRLISVDADHPGLGVVARKGLELVEAVDVHWAVVLEHPVVQNVQESVQRRCVVLDKVEVGVGVLSDSRLDAAPGVVEFPIDDVLGEDALVWWAGDSSRARLGGLGSDCGGQRALSPDVEEAGLEDGARERSAGGCGE